ncbi:NACHT domain-containing protein, partial [Streptomyces phytophilus]|uniref:NACHT domain-containing protein n=1 Tax=Streptomyces phytophilus TaxID=722715 RepID=UPI00215D9C73
QDVPVRASGRGRGVRRVGVVYLLLALLCAAGAPALVRYVGGEAAAAAAAVLCGVPPAYLSWKAFLHDRLETAAPTTAEAADRLAVAVRRQWEAEARRGRVHDPYELPIAWRAADEEPAESWPLLRETAASWPGGPPGDPAGWAREPGGLAGRGAEIGAVFAERVPTRRLVIVGEPGAGKSVLLIRLLLDLIERRGVGAPVPVLFSLASWNPEGQSLDRWLAEQLRRDHPGLRQPVPGSMAGPAGAGGPVDLAQALLAECRVLPLLDGFDELPGGLRPVALDAVNRALSAGKPLVLTSRAAAWRAAVTRPDAATAAVRLNGAAVIRLLGLDAERAGDYLRRDAGDDATAARRWGAVAAQLGTGSPVGQALSTPLGLFLARTVYNPRPGTAPPPAAAHPDELLDTARFPDRAAVSAHLCHGFVPAAYRPDADRAPRWTAARAQRTLAFLARFLHAHRDGSPDLAWWDLLLAPPTYLFRTAFGLAAGLVLGLMAGVMAGLAAGLATGLAFGLAAALVFGLVAALAARHAARSGPAPSAGLRWSSGEFAVGLTFGLTLGLTVGPAAGLVFGPEAGFTGGLVAGLTAGLTGGLHARGPDLTANTAPAALLTRDRRSFLTVGLALGLTAGLAAGLLTGVAAGLSDGLAVGLAVGLVALLAVGLTVGLLAGLAVGLTLTAWPYFVMARAYLTVRRGVPRNLMAFLKDAHDRGVLRQVGPVYQFRHIDLQRHLAQQPSGGEPERAAPLGARHRAVPGTPGTPG